MIPRCECCVPKILEWMPTENEFDLINDAETRGSDFEILKKSKSLFFLLETHMSNQC